ncbi:PspC domain-containing protein [Knoellia subterranea]|uniref:Phage shock protein PspC N-terminal domain-containing protein n=1 Tax=Knoellia subterranea KCTC 19937 TaxID=1385521 RepID=A0A0A0JNF4_9MICO|nr:PspC domain-containing protein [Knoellia subterranea]KGN37557.1 hypothetical protein N803_13125 [Knoellia subterranea KCTC 19937]
MTQTSGPNPATPTQGPGQTQGSKFWDDILSTGIRRDRSRQWFGGVCAGIARKVDVDPVLIRAAVIALTLFGGFGVVVYLIAWLLLPDETGRIMARDAIGRDGSADAGGAIALSVIALIVIAAIIFGDDGFLIGWGVIPLAVIGWLVWRHQQGKQAAATSPWVGAPVSGAEPQFSGTSMSRSGAMPASQPGSPDTTMYAASSAPAFPATSASAPVSPPASPSASAPEFPATSAPAHDEASAQSGSTAETQTAWYPPPAPPIPPRAHVPLAPPPPPRPRRRGAGFAGFALVLGAAIVGYGAGLMLDDPLNFPGSSELLGGIIGLAAASLATLIIGLMGRRSFMASALVLILGLGTAGAAIGEETLSNGQGSRTWVPSLSTTNSVYELGAGESTLDLRPLVDQLAAPQPAPSVAPTPSTVPTPSLAPAPAPTDSPSAGATPAPTVAPSASAVPAPSAAQPLVPQRIEARQGAGEMRIIVPRGANVRIVARSDFGEVVVRGDLPGAFSDRDNGNNNGPSETVTVNVGGAAPTIIVRADMRFGQITIQEG